ncbi:heme-copper oxidase family protein [Halobacterium litoreum]|uniref:Cytochrome C and Quinol oxidase polypeptide I n=1 Tax=Halobacterium litoreum TaxID=2039234 RepID=A0ABD5NC43_9EURY|nr:hypothetical protein [Halobacterium litoreum]UHH14372.1 hypothetical protein LT972_05070 [Halobacterium litoreum]
MSAVPGGLSTDQQPPMTIPLRYFLVGLGFLLAGGAVGLRALVAPPSGLAGLAHVHLLLVGWVCLTIAGAMTQFVPVWSNVPLHSRRLANATLALFVVGVAGLAWAFYTARPHWIHGFGGVLLAGVWAFVYNLGRTLAAARPFDATEAHFAFALACFAVVAPLGFALAMDFTTPLLPFAGVSRPQVVAAHATLAVFGAILATVLGALYQLGTMFTQTDLHGVDRHLARIEYGYPVGVVALAAGRLLAVRGLALAGGLLVAAGALAFAAILARKLSESQVQRTPMLSRYAVVAAGLAAWSVLAGVAWLRDPLAPAARFGPASAPHLLFVGVVGFVVAGSLYHVVPFVVWEHRYSDRIGFEPVPSIDGLYDGRVAALDFWLLAAGGLALTLSRADLLPESAALAGGGLLAAGFLAFAANLAGVVWKHGRVLPNWATGRAENAD